jgi:CubicO group peptidase (beta-lactamase class C family)
MLLLAAQVSVSVLSPAALEFINKEGQIAMMKRWTLLAALGLALLLICAGCGGGGRSDAPITSIGQFYPGDTAVPATGMTVAGVEAFDKNVSALLKKWNIPGASIAVARNGKLVLARGYGYADFEAKQPMQPDSMFRIGSISKILAAQSILQLEEQGKLDLDAKFLDVLNEYEVPLGGDERLRNVTIRNLLQHSGGWDRDKSGDPMGLQGTISRALHIPMPVMCPDVTRYMMGQPLDFTPGTKQVYSNFGYCILSQIIERVSGEPFEIYVRNHVLAPMDIHAMSIGYSQSLSQRGPHEVKYYEYNGAPMVDSVFPDGGKVPAPYGGFEILTIEASGGWIGSTVDLTRIMTVIDGSRGTPLLSTATTAEWAADPHLPSWFTGPDYWYGMGIFVGPTPDTWYHGGAIYGGKSQLLHDRNGYTWAIMTNSMSQDPGGLGNDLDLAMIQAIGTGFEGSATDLYPEYPSPVLPPRHH